MNESAEKHSKKVPAIALRPFVSQEKLADPCFEISASLAQSVSQSATNTLAFLDDTLPATHRGKTCISLSLQSKELFDTSFPDELLKKTGSRGIEPFRVWLEVSEAEALHQAAWRGTIPQLADYGFQVIVKQFVADHSDFEVLASPHIARIKVAPLVVADIAGSALARRFLKGLQTLSHAVNKQLIIDGVETLDQALWLQALGCNIFQGPYYGDVMDLRKAPNFVVERRHLTTPIVLEAVTV